MAGGEVLLLRREWRKSSSLDLAQTDHHRPRWVGLPVYGRSDCWVGGTEERVLFRASPYLYIKKRVGGERKTGLVVMVAACSRVPAACAMY